MKNQTQTVPIMSNGISGNSFAAQASQNNSDGKVTRDQINKFLSDLTIAMQSGEHGIDGLPWFEAPTEVITFYTNRKDFDEGSLSFIFQGVRVYEEGRRGEALERQKKSVPQSVMSNKNK